MKHLRKNLLPLLLAAPGCGILLLMLVGILKLYRIPTNGMSPTLIPGDVVFVTRSLRAPEEYHRGDLVVFRPPTNLKSRFIQRITALPGDLIDILDGHLAVNGVLLVSPTGMNSSPPARLQKLPPGCRRISFPLTVPDGHVFLMGDNYPNSLDSRYFGAVSFDSITQVPRLIVFPPGRLAGLD